MNAPTAKEPEPKTNGPGRLEKVPTGIQGLDEITCGGLPRGRTTLVCGGPGCGKTLMALEFLVHGATRFGEPGVFITFEETAGELATNGASLGFDLAALEADRKLAIDYVRIERSEIEESGEYDLEGLFIRIGLAIDSIGARRVAIDTLEVLFAGLPNPGILRAELRRLFRWLKEKGLTAIVTAERGDDGLTRHGLEEYISDCVITLDHRVGDQISTRRLRVLKYRGSAHDTDEVPFLIDEGGLSVLPISSLGLDHQAPTSRVSSGIPDLDAMLGGGGFYRGSTVLVSGGAGCGKTSLAASFARQACREGKRCLFFTFEESSSQVVRNMRSIGIDLAPLMEQDLLRFHASRPSTAGLEMHLARMHRLVSDFEPEVVVIDPITNLLTVGTASERAIDADPHDRFLQGPPDHRPPDEPDSRDPPEPGDLGRTHLLAGRHLDPGARDRVRRRAEPRALHPEIARHGPLEPGPRVPHDGPGDRADRRLPRHGRGPGRGGPRGPDDPR